MKRTLVAAIMMLVISIISNAETSSFHNLPHSVYSGEWDAGHVQGIAVDSSHQHIYFSFTTMLVKCDLRGNVIGTVEGLLGHLGCLAFNPADGRLYGSLEYKHDVIGKGILKNRGVDKNLDEAFYVAIFDVDKIDRVGMDAQSDGIMKSVYMPTVYDDYKKSLFACSGIDGISFGPAFGTPVHKADSAKRLLTVAYGTYGDIDRDDNDYQVLLQFDIADWSRYEQPLSEDNMHRNGPQRPMCKYFVCTGSTNWGVQNLEYDAWSHRWYMAVYKGKKPEYPNYSYFIVDGSAKPDFAKSLPYVGFDYEYGSTGLAALGGGWFYVSHPGSNGKMHSSTAVLTKLREPFAENGVIAHRGACVKSRNPENSFASFRAAAAIGCYGSECDVHFTADDSLVVNHNRHYGRWFIPDDNYSDVVTVLRDNGEKIPTFREYLSEVVKQHTTRLIIDMKCDKPEKREKFVDEVLRAIDDYDAREYVEFLSASLPVVDLLQRKTDRPVSYLGRWNEDLPEMVPDSVFSHGINIIDYQDIHYFAHPDWIPTFKKAGLTLNVWTVNNIADMNHFYEQGCDYITTDLAEAAMEVWNSRHPFQYEDKAVQEYLEPWKEGYLDIHYIATAKGDQTFVIMPDGTTMLIDCGDEQTSNSSPFLPNATRTAPQWVARYIRQMSEGLPHPDRVDYFLLSHYHSDHFGYNTGYSKQSGKGYDLTGVMELGEYLSFGKIVDREYPDYDWPSYQFIVDHTQPGFQDYISFVRSRVSGTDTQGEKFIVGSDSQFSMLNRPRKYRRQFSVRNIAASGVIAGKDGLQKIYDVDPKSLDENLFSTVLTINYGPFSFYHGGDIAGDQTDDNRNIERRVADAVGHVTAMKMDHHGYIDTGDPYFLKTLNPDVIFFPSSGSGVPTPECLGRVVSSLEEGGLPQMFVSHKRPRMFLGEQFNLFTDYGHMVIRVHPYGRAYQVYVLDAEKEDCPVKYKGDIISLK